MKVTTPPTILITGKNGQVGWELQRALLPLGHLVALDREGIDLADNDSLCRVVRRVKPDLIVNGAAYTAVDKAEEERDLAMQVNGIAPGVLAEEARRLDSLLIHYSTDYVFDGSKQTPYSETDTPEPINTYGAGKLAGERAVQAAGADHLILRTSWVYGARGSNFLLTMLRLMREREELRVVADQTGTPTWARLIAETTAQIIGQSLDERRRKSFQSAIYNLTSAGATTWHGFAEKIKAVAEQGNQRELLTIQNIEPVSTEEYPTPARRPRNSTMMITKLQQKYGLTMPNWDAALELCMEELS
ncbi:MAG: dTDP-4-dehydrorhamnose reductase [Desulfobacterales bacterium]|nr:dTDP-4-dehydrorhamnose reductase [Desulfobacterales bacterium]